MPVKVVTWKFNIHFQSRNIRIISYNYFKIAFRVLHDLKYLILK